MLVANKEFGDFFWPAPSGVRGGSRRHQLGVKQNPSARDTEVLVFGCICLRVKTNGTILG